MFMLGIAGGTIIGMALGISLALLMLPEKTDKKDKYKCEIEEVWIDEGAGNG